jgi:hypothetical protein
MSLPLPVRLLPEEKLDLLRYLDEFHFWHSLDDRRLCKRCQKQITGRQIEVMKGSGLRLQCPTEGCESTSAEWIYEDPVSAAKRPCDPPFPRAISDQKSNR